MSTVRVADTGKADDPKDPKDTGSPKGLTPISGELLRGVRVLLEARLGKAAMTVEEMMALKAGSVVTLEAGLADHVDVYLNDVLIARGEVVAVGENYGVRIVDIVPSVDVLR